LEDGIIPRKNLFVILAVLLILILSSLVLVFNHPESKSTVTNSSKRAVPIEVDDKIPDVSKLNAKINGSLDEKITKEEALFISHFYWGYINFRKATWDLNASLTSDGKYWKITEEHNYTDGYECDYIDTYLINAENGRSRLIHYTYYDGWSDHYKTDWASFSSLKADYVFAMFDDTFQYGYGNKEEYGYGKAVVPTEAKQVTINGSKIWKKSIYLGTPGELDSIENPYFYKNVYFDSANGKTRIGDGKWMSPKELDEWYAKNRQPARQFQNPLRYLYPE